MLSARINPDNSDNEGGSTMPGDYEQLPRVGARVPPTSSAASPSRPAASRPRRRSPIVPPRNAPPRRRPPRPQHSPVRVRQRRQRSLTPDVVIHRRGRHHSSPGRHRVFRIPLDNRPTLGLRGPPKRILELERVRCRRRRRRRSPRYELDYDEPPQAQLQPNVVIANPISNPCLPPVQPSFMGLNGNPSASAGLFANLTAEMIENLPKQTVHLPAIHLPGSQANAETELHTVLFPAEIINPVDGTLSIIQANSMPNGGQTVNAQSPSVLIPAQPQPQSIIAPSNGTPLGTYLSTASGPFMQQVQDLLQRITLSQPQSTLPTANPNGIQRPISFVNPSANQSSLPIIPQSNQANNRFPNPQSISRINSNNIGSYPSANIRPTNTSNTGAFNSTSSVPSNPRNIRPPFRPSNMATFEPSSGTPNNPRNPTPYRPANLSTFQPTRGAPSSSSDIGPYRPANITALNSTRNRSVGSTTLPPSAPYGTTPYTSSPSLGSPGALNSFHSRINNDSTNVSNLSPTQTPYQSDNPAPRSILRNGQSNAQINTTYTHLNSPNVSSSRGIVRKATTFA
ncbi:unnamed protein product [Adineta steineri]|uniref:Uncharacterized protein n=1 Tax=Adineta steineri TaxID=433720 RepID=A0A819J0X4_9BILA|nr:unnamed protein product [Adineta steineri]CAF3921708.1 unnamed protein product [Adineta steineri]